jgi:hypothetical protein
MAPGVTSTPLDDEISPECAAADDGGPRIAVAAVKRQRPATDLDQRAAGAPDNAAHRGREIVAADDELV